MSSEPSHKSPVSCHRICYTTSSSPFKLTTTRIHPQKRGEDGGPPADNSSLLLKLPGDKTEICRFRKSGKLNYYCWAIRKFLPHLAFRVPHPAHHLRFLGCLLVFLPASCLVSLLAHGIHSITGIFSPKFQYLHCGHVLLPTLVMITHHPHHRKSNNL